VSNFEWHGFGVVIDLGTERRWRLLLELMEANESGQTHEMFIGSRTINVTSAETIGLTLADGKSILAATQTQLVQDLERL
jgi:hypothetical protein